MCTNWYDFIFVVLVYRNIKDLEDFFKNLNISNSKVVVINSFYDVATEQKFKSIAETNNADFLSVPNKGYGAGNNKGIEYVLNHYNDFKYLIVSNADIIIKSLSIDYVQKYGDSIIAPEIINASNRRQNPSMPFVPSLFVEKVRYWLYNGNHFKLIWVYFISSRLKKILYYLISPLKKNIFSAHGAFVIMSKHVVETLVPIYNEDMFLFNEEEHLGRKALLKGIKTYYAKNINIFHKEDGSMKIANVNELDRMRQSFLVYYDFWFNNK